MGGSYDALLTRVPRLLPLLRVTSMKENDLLPSVREDAYELGRMICGVWEEGIDLR